MNERMRWGVVVLYASAMAWVEAAAVVYLRILIDRVQPYQTDPLPVSVGLGQIELVRELATLVMLGTVAVLAGQTWQRRIGYAMLSFGTWDLCYYVFLVPMSHWPRSPLDWDILFLVPLPWWGPVLAPCMIAVLLVLTGTSITQSNPAGSPQWAGTRAWLASGVGVAVALYVFMVDALGAASGGMEAIRQVLPRGFNWPLFSAALVLLGAPLLETSSRWVARKSASRAFGLSALPESSRP